MKARIGKEIAAALLVLGAVPGAWAQVTAAAAGTPPDDTPSVKVGGTIFTDYTYLSEPKATDAEKNSIHSNAFNVSRAYINVTGQVSHWVSFRITPDITKQTTTVSDPNKTGVGVSTSLDNSLAFRLKYAFGQLNLDTVVNKGSWIRLGVQQTPWVDFAENIYRYRFQGTIFEDKEGFLTSSDFGASAHLNFPHNYGDVHFGVYNGDGFGKGEANDQKALQIRASIRPAPKVAELKGLRFTGFYDADNFIRNGEKKRFVGAATYEHDHVNAGINFLDVKDQTVSTAATKHGNGFSLWITPRFGNGIEALFRYDSLKPNKDADGRRKRTIAGLAYWFPVQKGVSAAILADYERVKNDAALAKPDERRYALHAVVNF